MGSGIGDRLQGAADDAERFAVEHALLVGHDSLEVVERLLLQARQLGAAGSAEWLGQVMIVEFTTQNFTAPLQLRICASGIGEAGKFSEHTFWILRVCCLLQQVFKQILRQCRGLGCWFVHGDVVSYRKLPWILRAETSSSRT